MRGRATSVVLPALAVLALVGGRRDRRDRVDAGRLRPDASSVGYAARHALHTLARGDGRRWRAARLRPHAAQGDRAGARVGPLSAVFAPGLARVRRHGRGRRPYSAPPARVEHGRSRRRDAPSGVGHVVATTPEPEGDLPRTSQRISWFVGCRGRRSRRGGRRCIRRVTTARARRRRVGGRARRAARALHSTTRSTTSVPRRIHGARSSRHTLAWSAYWRRAACRDMLPRRRTSTSAACSATSHPTPTPSSA